MKDSEKQTDKGEAGNSTSSGEEKVMGEEKIGRGLASILANYEEDFQSDEDQEASDHPQDDVGESNSPSDFGGSSSKKEEAKSVSDGGGCNVPKYHWLYAHKAADHEAALCESTDHPETQGNQARDLGPFQSDVREASMEISQEGGAQEDETDDVQVLMVLHAILGEIEAQEKAQGVVAERNEVLMIKTEPFDEQEYGLTSEFSMQPGQIPSTSADHDLGFRSDFQLDLAVESSGGSSDIPINPEKLLPEADVQSLPCPLCPSDLPTVFLRERLRPHISAVHLQYLPIRCDTCGGATVASRDELACTHSTPPEDLCADEVKELRNPVLEDTLDGIVKLVFENHRHLTASRSPRILSKNSVGQKKRGRKRLQAPMQGKHAGILRRLSTESKARINPDYQGKRMRPRIDVISRPTPVPKKAKEEVVMCQLCLAEGEEVVVKGDRVRKQHVIEHLGKDPKLKVVLLETGIARISATEAYKSMMLDCFPQMTRSGRVKRPVIQSQHTPASKAGKMGKKPPSEKTPKAPKKAKDAPAEKAPKALKKGPVSSSEPPSEKTPKALKKAKDAPVEKTPKAPKKAKEPPAEKAPKALKTDPVPVSSSEKAPEVPKIEPESPIAKPSKATKRRRENSVARSNPEPSPSPRTRRGKPLIKRIFSAQSSKLARSRRRKGYVFIDPMADDKALEKGCKAVVLLERIDHTHNESKEEEVEGKKDEEEEEEEEKVVVWKKNQCRICRRCIRPPNQLKHSLAEHYKKGLLRCPFCHTASVEMDPSEVRVHITTEHPQEDQSSENGLLPEIADLHGRCFPSPEIQPSTSTDFPSPPQLDREDSTNSRRKRRKLEIGGKPRCLICHCKVPEEESTEDHVYRHLATDEAKARFICCVVGCDESYFTLDQVLGHCRVSHEGKQDFKDEREKLQEDFLLKNTQCFGEETPSDGPPPLSREDSSPSTVAVSPSKRRAGLWTCEFCDHTNISTPLDHVFAHLAKAERMYRFGCILNGCEFATATEADLQCHLKEFHELESLPSYVVSLMDRQGDPEIGKRAMIWWRTCFKKQGNKMPPTLRKMASRNNAGGRATRDRSALCHCCQVKVGPLEEELHILEHLARLQIFRFRCSSCAQQFPAVAETHGHVCGASFILDHGDETSFREPFDKAAQACFGKTIPMVSTDFATPQSSNEGSRVENQIQEKEETLEEQLAREISELRDDPPVTQPVQANPPQKSKKSRGKKKENDAQVNNLQNFGLSSGFHLPTNQSPAYYASANQNSGGYSASTNQIAAFHSSANERSPSLPELSGNNYEALPSVNFQHVQQEYPAAPIFAQQHHDPHYDAPGPSGYNQHQNYQHHPQAPNEFPPSPAVYDDVSEFLVPFAAGFADSSFQEFHTVQQHHRSDHSGNLDDMSFL